MQQKTRQCYVQEPHQAIDVQLFCTYRHIESLQKSVQKRLHKLDKQAPALFLAVQLIHPVIVEVICFCVCGASILHRWQFDFVWQFHLDTVLCFLGLLQVN